MNVALIGASGFIGSALRQEALSRGHRVTALVTHPDRLQPATGLSIVQVDVHDTPALAAALTGVEVVISAFSGHAQADVRGYYVAGVESIVAAVKAAGVPRLLIVGGAGGLEVAPGVRLLDTPGFPAQWKGTAEGAWDALTLLRSEAALDWAMLAPPAHIEPGERTGRYRVGTDALLVDAKGDSHISVQDYAVAMIDELETPQHRRARFTVAEALG